MADGGSSWQARSSQKIKAHAEPDGRRNHPGTELTALGIHSLELTEIVFDLEEAYGIEIEMNTVEAWNNLKNVGDIVDRCPRADRKNKPDMAGPRIVITGLGGMCALGSDAPAIWHAMRAGRSAIGPIDGPPLHELKGRIGAEIKTLPDIGLERRRLVTMDRFSLLAVIAAAEALPDKPELP